jgi:hypothetical protein
MGPMHVRLGTTGFRATGIPNNVLTSTQLKSEMSALLTLGWSTLSNIPGNLYVEALPWGGGPSIIHIAEHRLDIVDVGDSKWTSEVTRAIGIALAGAIFTACTDGENTTLAVIHTDSAGVSIAENGPTDLERLPEWTLGDLRLDIGVVEGEEAYQLFGVTDAHRLRDGGVLVLNGGTGELRFYGGDGVHVRSVGRRGGGPGEFRTLTETWVLSNDTIAVWDRRLRRISFFGPNGTFLRDAKGEGAAGLLAAAVTVFGDGSFVLSDLRLDNPVPCFRMVPQSYVRYETDGRFGYSLPTQAFGEMGVMGDRIGPKIFAGTASTAGSETHYWVGLGRGYEVRRYRRDGTLDRIVCWNGPERTVGQALVDAHWDARLADAENESQRARLRRVREIQQAADQHAAYTSLIRANDGYLWVKAFDPPPYDGDAKWLVISPEGELVARVTTPRLLQITEIGPDFVLGHEPDALEVEHVRVYDLDRS